MGSFWARTSLNVSFLNFGTFSVSNLSTLTEIDTYTHQKDLCRYTTALYTWQTEITTAAVPLRSSQVHVGALCPIKLKITLSCRRTKQRYAFPFPSLSKMGCQSYLNFQSMTEATTTASPSLSYPRHLFCRNPTSQALKNIRIDNEAVGGETCSKWSSSKLTKILRYPLPFVLLTPLWSPLGLSCPNLDNLFQCE